MVTCAGFSQLLETLTPNRSAISATRPGISPHTSAQPHGGSAYLPFLPIKHSLIKQGPDKQAVEGWPDTG